MNGVISLILRSTSKEMTSFALVLLLPSWVSRPVRPSRFRGRASSCLPIQVNRGVGLIVVPDRQKSFLIDRWPILLELSVDSRSRERNTLKLFADKRWWSCSYLILFDQYSGFRNVHSFLRFKSKGTVRRVPPVNYRSARLDLHESYLLLTHT